MVQNGMQVEAASRVTLGSTQTLSKAVRVAAVGLTFGFVTFMLSTIAGMQLGNTLLRPSPFIPYEALWPGQSLESLQTYMQHLPERQLLCSSAVLSSPGVPYSSTATYSLPNAAMLSSELVCSHAPPSGMFRSVTVRLKNSRITQLELISDMLPEDVLLLYWGMPDAISRMGNERRLNLFWERGAYSAMATVLEASSLVRIVTLTANP